MKIGLGAGAAVLAEIALGLIGSGDDSRSSSTRTSTPAAPAIGSTPTRSVAAAPTTTERAGSNLTPGQKNAIAKAESYLDYTAFSRQGFIEQLEFSGFTPAQAQHGANVAHSG